MTTYRTETIERDQLDARMADLAAAGWTLHSLTLMPSQIHGDNPVFLTIWQQ